MSLLKGRAFSHTVQFCPGKAQIGLTSDLLLIKDFTVRSSLERHPSARGDHCHAATLPSRHKSEKAHLGCHIYGVKWLAHTQIAYNGRGMRDTSHTHCFLCSSINLAVHVLVARSVLQGHTHWCLCSALNGYSEEWLVQP